MLQAQLACCIEGPLGKAHVACRLEGIFFGGFKGEIWVQKGKPPSQARAASVLRQQMLLLRSFVLSKHEAAPGNALFIQQ